MVDVAPVDEALFVAQRARRRNADDVELPTCRVALAGEVLTQLGDDCVIRVLWVELLVQQQRARSGESRDDVDVPVGAELVVVTREPAREPDRARRPERASEFSLDASLVCERVAAGVELHGLSREDRALAVHVNAAALVHEEGAHEFRAAGLGDDAADACRLLPLRPGGGAPAIEDPVDGAEHAWPFVVGDECRSDVAHPELVERCLEDLDSLAEHAAGARELARVHDHRDGLEACDRVGDRRPGGVAGLALRCAVAERDPLAGEGHPGAIVRRRLGGHLPGHVRVLQVSKRVLLIK